MRKKLLVDQLFAPPLLALTRLLEELVPDRDPTLLALSISGMVMFQLETRATAHLLPGWKPEHAESDQIVRHLCELLQAMFGAGHANDAK